MKCGILCKRILKHFLKCRPVRHFFYCRKYTGKHGRKGHAKCAKHFVTYTGTQAAPKLLFMIRQLLLLIVVSTLFFIPPTTAYQQLTTKAIDTLMPVKNGPQLKPKSLTAETLIASGAMAGSLVLDGKQLAALSLKTIDKGFAPTLRYHLIDTLYKSNGHYILLLGQWYDYENKAWVASYAAPHQLIDFKLVFYDNAEGFLSVETEIKDNLLTITTLNEYEEGAAKKKVEKLKFGTQFKLHKL